MSRAGWRRRTVLGLALAGGIPWQVRAEQTGPAAPIAALDAALLRIMRAGAATPFAARAAILAPVIGRSFDLPQILRTSVGPRFASLPPAQQAELLDVFTRYTVASYVANFDGYSGEQFDILPQTRAVGAEQVVQTRIVPVDGEPTRIDYVMRPAGNAWRAVDVLLDGSISRVAVQRSDFRSLLDDGGAAALIASLRRKVAILEAGGKS
jgi:phospholipid transport system substrate-binding protein